MVAIVAEKLDKAPTSKQFTDKKPREGLSAPASKADAMTWETIRNLIHDEWAILSLLLLWSVAGVAVICERIYSLWRVLPKSETFKNRVVEAVEKGDLAKADSCLIQASAHADWPWLESLRAGVRQERERRRSGMGASGVSNGSTTRSKRFFG